MTGGTGAGTLQGVLKPIGGHNGLKGTTSCRVGARYRGTNVVGYNDVLVVCGGALKGAKRRKEKDAGNRTGGSAPGETAPMLACCRGVMCVNGMSVGGVGGSGVPKGAKGCQRVHIRGAWGGVRVIHEFLGRTLPPALPSSSPHPCPLGAP